MNFEHPETSLGVEDWKAYDVCERHQELADEKYPIDRV